MQNVAHELRTPTEESRAELTELLEDAETYASELIGIAIAIVNDDGDRLALAEAEHDRDLIAINRLAGARRSNLRGAMAVARKIGRQEHALAVAE